MTERDLQAIEAIKQLKACYWRAVDTKDSAMLHSVLAHDCLVDFRDAMGAHNEAQLWRTAERFCADTMAVTAGVVTVHHGFPPEITVTAPDEAEAIWPFEDLVWVEGTASALPFRRFRGWGHYRDRYRKTETGWKIARTTISRLRIETE